MPCGDGRGQAAGRLPLAEPLVETGNFLTKGLFQDNFVDVQPFIAEAVQVVLISSLKS
jgi:hypothetical protein